MNKLDTPILVIPRTEFDKRGEFQGFMPIKDREDVGRYLGMGDNGEKPLAFFKRRGDAEEDPNFKQIIPYIVLVCGTSVFTYTRSKGGGENRLHDQLSIGLGGHVDSTDDDDPFWAYLKAVKRELMEEVGLDLNHDATKGTLAGLVNDDLDNDGKHAVPVGQVHLGLVHIINLNETMAAAVLKNAHEREIENPRFIPVGEFRDNAYGIFDKLESWSKMVANHFIEDLNSAGPWQDPSKRERLILLGLTATKVGAAVSGLLLQENKRGYALGLEVVEQHIGEFQCMLTGTILHKDVDRSNIEAFGNGFRQQLPTITNHQNYTPASAPEPSPAPASDCN